MKKGAHRKLLEFLIAYGLVKYGCNLMKKFCILIAICLGVWTHFSKNSQLLQPNKISFSTANYTSTHNFKCDGREYCSQMTSRAEAEFFNKNCPNTKMDGDHDGKPCENDSRF